MPLRIVNLFPREDDFNIGSNYDGSGVGGTFQTVFPNGSPYGGSPSIPIWQAWRDDGDPAGVLPPSGSGCSGAGGTGNTSPCTYTSPLYGRTLGAKIHTSCRFDPPPTLSLYNKVTFHIYWDYAGTGANLHTFPPTNDHGPQVRLALRNRANNAWILGPTLTEGGFDGSTGSPVGNRYCNMNQPSCGGGYDGPIHIEEVYALGHPEGGPWTQDDLVNLSAGIYMELAPPVYDVAQPFPRHRVFHVHVEVEVQDLGGYVTNIQHDASLALRMYRKARNAVALVIPGDEAYVPLGNRRMISHPDGPAIVEGGWGDRVLERRATQVLSRAYFPESFSVVDEAYDLRDFVTNFWLATMIDTAWTPELIGFSYLDLGGGRTYVRANQDGWSMRPGDGVHVRVLKDSPILSFHGLNITNGLDIERSLQNSNLQNAAWTVTNSGGAVTVTPTIGNGLVDELGFLDAIEVAYSTGTRAWQQNLGTVDNASANLLHVRVVTRNVAVSSPLVNYLEWELRREYLVATVPTTEYWNATTRAWVGVNPNNAIPADGGFGEVISDAIPCDVTADAPPTYFVKVGRFSSNINATFILALVDVQLGGPLNGDSYGARPPLVSLGSTITRVADDFKMANGGDGKGWFVDRGVAIMEFEPEFRSDALPTSELKPLLFAMHNTTGTFNTDTLSYIKGAPSIFRFRRHVDGVGNFDIDVDVTTPLTRDHAVRAYVRWLDSDGWQGYGPHVISVGFAVFNRATGTLIEEGQAHGQGYDGSISLDADPDEQVVRIGYDLSSRLDGYVRMVDIKRNPIAHEECIWRR